ncbi:MAG: hypothetical protein P8Y51_01355 [Campylobacterales bacterium]
MTRLVAVLLLPLMLFAGETMRIATYNVENLFDLQRSGNEYAEYIPNTPWQWNAKNYRPKTTASSSRTSPASSPTSSPT